MFLYRNIKFVREFECRKKIQGVEPKDYPIFHVTSTKTYSAIIENRDKKSKAVPENFIEFLEKHESELVTFSGFSNCFQVQRMNRDQKNSVQRLNKIFKQCSSCKKTWGIATICECGSQKMEIAMVDPYLIFDKDLGVKLYNYFEIEVNCTN